MAIKKIREIPAKRSFKKKQNKRKTSQRGYVLRDIQYAIESRISLFEFVGDCYNYDNLKPIADSEFRYKLRQCVDPILEKIDPKERYLHDKYRNIIKYIETDSYNVVTRKLEDRTHVYCELNFDLIDNLENLICHKIHEAKVRGRL